MVISAPSCITASVRHETMRCPPTRIVHAPHAPWSQPFLVPVRFARSRSMSSSDVRLSTVMSRASPLLRTRTPEDVAVFACSSSPQPASSGAVATTPPTAMDAPTKVLRFRSTTQPSIGINPVRGCDLDVLTGAAALGHPAGTRVEPDYVDARGDFLVARDVWRLSGGGDGAGPRVGLTPPRV